MGVIFVAGVYGVGKSVLCGNLSTCLGIPSYSASDLISEVNGEIYGANKIVIDKVANQYILKDQVERLITKYEKIILAGHFCLLDNFGAVDYLPEDVFSSLKIDCIFLLEADPKRTQTNLYERDKKTYTVEQIRNLKNKERKMATRIASKLACPLYTHKMSFDGYDAEFYINIIKQEGFYESFIGH